MGQPVLSPTEFVAITNQVLETAWPSVIIEGELSGLRVSKNRWVYFSLKDEQSSVDFFGSIFDLPGPLEDGLMVRVVGNPRLHHKFGFTVNVRSIIPVGEGALKKAALLLQKKLQAEGLFAPERKRVLPSYPQTIGLLTANKSAAFADFIKVVNSRWAGLQIILADVYVQGEKAPSSIVSAINAFNTTADLPDVLVITRGGGGLDDLAAFNDERVVRAVAASRAPTLVAIGHEVDLCLAELAADVRASTPSNAAEILVPDKRHELSRLKDLSSDIVGILQLAQTGQTEQVNHARQFILGTLEQILEKKRLKLEGYRSLLKALSPQAVLSRGYAILTKNGRAVISVTGLKAGDQVAAQLADGTIQTEVISVDQNA